MKALILVFTFLVHTIGPILAIDTKSVRSELVSLSQATTLDPPVYTFPSNIDKNRLIQSSVFLECGFARGTGVVIGERFILTAAHTIGGHFLRGCKISCFGIKSVADCYIVPVLEASLGIKNEEHYFPDYSSCDDLCPIDIKRVHLLPRTSFSEINEKPKSYTLAEVIRRYKESLGYGVTSAEENPDFGVSSVFMNDPDFLSISFKAFGPDVAILESAEPHNLPVVRISEPIEEARVMLHIVGLTGLRYQNNSTSEIIAGIPCINGENVGDIPAYVFQPRIIGQRFTCLPAYATGEKKWINRVFLRKVEGKYLLDDQVYPNAPEGFGLIAEGDSGAGAFICRNGQPLLVGITSNGNIKPVFINIQNYLLSLNFDEGKIYEDGGEDGRLLLKFYRDSLKEIDPSKKWFITQALADVTHIKEWIDSIVLK